MSDPKPCPLQEGELREALRVKPPRWMIDMTFNLDAVTAEMLKAIMIKDGTNSPKIKTVKKIVEILVYQGYQWFEDKRGDLELGAS